MDGSELKSLRAEAGYKGRELAAILGITPNTLSRYETGKLRITRLVEYASRYVCQRRLAQLGPEGRLVAAIREALDNADASQ